ncbi:unnamed protein product [Rhizoctonia solani]|uniref:SH3 domain-containing protein n=1 Tax=Rhizoctonia solani TaxID=456999 RepID=A0A8H3BYR9_9AGAM|nr:unnamed protein product [Rhizoctonia solani]
MFVLQDCSICFEDYDAERQPHSIPCGHVFCQPCLESLVSTSPQCPNCRVSYASASIRKVICTLQDEQPTGSAAQDSEAEGLMWQAIQSAIESPEDLKQRKSVVHNNPHDALLASGMSKNVLTALAIMGLLVQVEEKNGSLKDKLNTAWAVEESLRDHISHLEAKLSMAGTNTCPSSEHFKLLLADVHKLQSVVEVINKNTSDFARQLSARPEPPVPQARPTEIPERRTPAPIPPPAPVPVPEPAPTPMLKKQPSRPGILRKSLTQDTSNSVVNSPVESPITSRASLGTGNPPRQDPFGPTHHRYPSTPTPTRQLMSPPMTPSVLPEQLDGPSLFGQMPQASRWKSAVPPPSYSGPGITSTEQASRWKSAVPPPSYSGPGTTSTEQASPPITKHSSMASASIPQRTHMAHLSMPTPSVPLNATNPTFVQHRPPNSSMASAPIPQRTHMAHLSMPTPSVPLNATNPTFVQHRPPPTPTPTQPSSSHSIRNTPLPTTPIPAPAPTPTPRPQAPPRTLTAIFDFMGKSTTEISLRNGQKLYLLPESDTNQDWIWCRDENGKTGYVPKSYVKVDSA